MIKLTNVTDRQKRLVAYGVMVLAIIIAAGFGVSYPVPAPPFLDDPPPDPNVIGPQAVRYHNVNALRVRHELNSQGAVDFDSTLNVDGASTLGGAITFSGAGDFDSTLNVDGATTLNSTLDVDGNISSGTGAITMTDNLMIDGAADAVQLTVQGYTTQTNSSLVVENSSGTDQFTVGNTGNMVVNGTSVLSGAVTMSTTLDVAGGSITLQNDETIGNSTDGLITLGGGLQLSSVNITDTQTITPTAYSMYVINATGEATVTLAACSNVGQIVYLYADDAQTINYPATNILTTNGNALQVNQYDLVGLVCATTEWALMFEVNLQ